MTLIGKLRAVTFVIAASASLSTLAVPISLAHGQQSLSDDDWGIRRDDCMTTERVRQFVGAKGYSDMSVSRADRNSWHVEAVKDGSLYALVVDTCTPRIVSHRNVGAA